MSTFQTKTGGWGGGVNTDITLMKTSNYIIIFRIEITKDFGIIHEQYISHS